MQTKNKSSIPAAIIAVLISVSLVALAVYATTTVGNDVSVGGTLTVTGTSTLASTLYVNQATGRVGIGTTSPSVALDVAGAITATGTGTFDKLALSDDSCCDYDQITSPAWNFGFQSTYAGVNDYTSFNVLAPIGKNIHFYAFADGAGGDWLRYIMMGANEVETGIPEGMFIGTSGPLNFHTHDTLDTDESPDFDDYIQFKTTSHIPEITTVGACDLKINAGGSNDLLLNDGGGNVGIGTTTSPLGDLHVLNATASSTVYVGDATHSGCIVMGDSDNVGLTYITVLDGVLTATSTKPAICK